MTSPPPSLSTLGESPCLDNENMLDIDIRNAVRQVRNAASNFNETVGKDLNPASGLRAWLGQSVRSLTEGVAIN